MRYRVGDKVRIRTDLRVNIKYGNCDYIYEMEKYKGKTAYITEIYRSKFNDVFSLDIDNGEWGWTDGMVEPVTIKNTYEDRNMKYILDGDKTIVIQYYTDKDGVKRYRKGISKKHPLDIYNESLGMIYAIANAYDIDKKLIHIGECKCHKNENNINKNKEEKELEFIKKFKEKKIAINVQSKKEAENFIELLYKYNVISKDNINNFINKYDSYKENISYSYNFGNFGSVGYDSVSFHKKEGWEIIQYKDIFKNNINLVTISTEDLLEELKKRVK